MFDLEQKILEWRQQLTDAGLSRSEQLDELEDHLRNEIEDQLRSGADLRAAFEVAVKHVGRASALKVEFEKASSAKQKRWPFWALGAKTAIFLIAASGIAPAAIYFAFGFATALKTVIALFGVLVTAVSAWLLWWNCRSSPATTRFEPIGGFTLSPNAQQSLDIAILEVQRLGHDYVGTEHLLLALLRHDGGVIGTALAKAGVAREALRVAIEERITANIAQGIGPSLPYTPRLNKALLLAAREAARNRKEMEAGHILLGLLRERHGIAGRVLRSLGFNIEQVRSCLVTS